MSKKELNYTILSDNINEKLLSNCKDYNIIGNISFDELIKLLENYLSKTIVFNETFYNFKNDEINKIISLLKMRNINFINITSNIEETLLGDYIYILNNGKVIIEGGTKKVLEEEKILKHLGFGLPFVVDLSTQLKCYGILNKIYYNMESLVNDLWN